MKTIFAIAALGATLIAGTALAQDRPIEPSTPRPISDFHAVGTISGMIVALADEGFVIRDDSGEIRVETEHLRVGDIGPGQLITVTGTLERDKFEARHIIREDGSVIESIEDDED